MKTHKTLYTALTIAALFFACSCSNTTHEEVVATYPDGSNKLVMRVSENRSGEKTRIGETAYYENGNVQYEKSFADDKPAGKWTFYYDDGTVFAQGNYDQDHQYGSDWQFFAQDSTPLYSGDFDSVIVLQATADNRPLSIAYCQGNDQMRYRFNDNYTVNARGKIIDGQKQGRWEFYYANGRLQMEAQYDNGRENGAYNSYRENGIPYFRGFYINGRRAHIWEFYDEKGNLAGTQDFDKH